MRLAEVLGGALEGLTTNKLRALLTMLGVIIGVAAVIVMVAVSAGTEATIAEQINSLGANLIFVSPYMARSGPTAGRGQQMPSLTFDDAEAIVAQVSSVIGYAVEQQTSQTVKFGNVSIDGVTVIGTTPDFPSVREVKVADGRFFNAKEVERESKVAVLGPSLAKELFGEADPIGQKVTVGTTKLTVVGLMASKGTVGGADWDVRLYTPITVVFSKFMPARFAQFMGHSVRQIYVQVRSQEDIENAILQISLVLARRHNVTLEEPDFMVTTQQDIIDTRASTTAAFRNLLAWVAGVSLIVGGIGIMNIMLVSVTERTREIGIRQSVGATENDIRMQFLSEALMLSLVGGLIGVICGVGGSWLFGRLGDMRTVVVPTSILLAFCSAAAVGIFFGYYPANKAAQLDPIEALR
ncbi:MAG: FtsX-like permease family protein, partial [Chloroflexi bacterium]|nr:FtsX-like permease family protein [Chloroflexota bacterium]